MRLSQAKWFDGALLSAPHATYLLLVRQVDYRTFHGVFGGFIDPESEILGTQINFMGKSGKSLYMRSFEGAVESWEGTMQGSQLPQHAAAVRLCVTVTNEANLKTVVCSAFARWDREAPQLDAFYLLNPLTGFFRTDSVLYTNVSSSLKFAVRLSETLPGKAIQSATWKLSRHKLSQPDNTFISIGHADRLAEGNAYRPVLEVATTEEEMLPFQEGERHYVNIYLCDPLDNCKIHYSPAIVLDSSPPPRPQRLIADCAGSTSADGVQQFFVSLSIQPGWLLPNEPFAAFSRDQLQDPNKYLSDPDMPNAPLDAQVHIYEVGAFKEGGRRHAGGPIRLPYKEGGRSRCLSPTYVRLGQGKTYMLELHQMNSAGGQSTMRSEHIIVDLTPPVCTFELSFFHGTNVVQIGQRPAGSTASPTVRNRVHLPSEPTPFGLRVPDRMCVDPESGIYSAEVRMVAGGHYLYRRIVQEGDGNINFYNGLQPLVSLPSGVTWKQIKEVTVEVECLNGAAVKKTCDAVVYVDQTGPSCLENRASLGHSHQSDTDTLVLSMVAADVNDPETGVFEVAYTLLNVAVLPGLGKLAPPLSLPEFTHLNPPPLNGLRISGLDMLHGHTYQVAFAATNNGGKVGTVCHTSKVTIDTTPPVPGLLAILQHDADNDVPTPSTSHYQYSRKVIRIATRSFTDPESGIRAFYVTVYRSDGWLILPETWAGDREFMVVPCDLNHKSSFYVEMRAMNEAGLSVVVTSTNVSVDTTRPRIEFVRDSFAAAKTLNNGHTTLVRGLGIEIGTVFAAYDSESGIGSADYCLGSFPGACDALQPQRLPHFWMWEVETSVGGLVEGATYYSLIIVTNNAGGEDFHWSDGFVIDNLAPDCGVVFDGPGVDRAFIGPTMALASVITNSSGHSITLGSLTLSWNHFVDHGSGLGGFEAAITTSKVHTSDAQFVNMGLAASTIFITPVEHSVAYYGVVRVQDRLGNEQECFSDGVLYDATPCDMSHALVESLLATYPHSTGLHVQKVQHLLHGAVHGITDPESGVRQYFVAVGPSISDPEGYASFRSIGMAGEFLVGGLSMADGDAFVTVRVVNGAFESAEASLTIGIDTGAPLCSDISIWGHPAGEAFQATEIDDYLEANWTCIDIAPWAHIPITCEWAVGTSPGEADAMDWTPAQSNGTHAWQDATLENGVMYFVTVQCSDQVGHSVRSTSGGLMPDLVGPRVTVPAAIVSPHTGRETHFWGFASEISCVWAFDDGESGIMRIRALFTDTAGSPPTLDAMPHELSVIPSQRRALLRLDTSFALQHNVRYYLHICAEDWMNHTVCSPAYSFLVDLTPPVCTPPEDILAGLPGPEFFSTRTGYQASWHCNDPESGVLFSDWMAYQDGTIPMLTRFVRQLGGQGYYSVVIPSYISGTRFSSCVFATNGAELYMADRDCSHGVVFDGTAATISGVHTTCL